MYLTCRSPPPILQDKARNLVKNISFLSLSSLLVYHLGSYDLPSGEKAEKYMHTHYTRDVIAEDIHRRLLQIYHMVFRTRDISETEDHDLL